MLATCGSPKGDGATAPSGTASTEGVKKEGFPIVDEPITLTVMSQDAGVADWNTMPVLQEMEKLSGIKLEYQLSPIDSFETKKNLVFASGDLPDMFYAADLKPAEQVTYGAKASSFRWRSTLTKVMHRTSKRYLTRTRMSANPSQPRTDISMPCRSLTRRRMVQRPDVVQRQVPKSAKRVRTKDY